MNILAPIDFSDATPKILAEVKKLGKALSAKVWLLHVAEPKPGLISYTGGFADYGAGFVDYGPDPKTLRKQIAQNFNKDHKALQKKAETLRAEGIETTALLIQGVILDVIFQEIDKLAIDMIVIGSHGHGAVYNLLVGSVSKGILKKARCPVLMIPTHPDATKKTSAA